MKLTVFGRCGPYPRANEACSGYLVSAGGTNLLMDCGPGTLSRLRTTLTLPALDAVVLSHLHYDHCADMAVMRYALEQTSCAPLPVFCPAEPAEAHLMFDSPVFDIHPLREGLQVSVGALSLSFYEMKHPIPTFGLCVQDAESSLFYTGDTGWFDELVTLVQGADALLCDCCFTDADADKPEVHLSARQAGKLAMQAAVKTLYCTHVWGGASDDEALKREVGFVPAVVVQEMSSYMLSSK